MSHPDAATNVWIVRMRPSLASCQWPSRTSLGLSVELIAGGPIDTTNSIIWGNVEREGRSSQIDGFCNPRLVGNAHGIGAYEVQ